MMLVNVEVFIIKNLFVNILQNLNEMHEVKGSGFHLENLPTKSDVLGILEDSIY